MALWTVLARKYLVLDSRIFSDTFSLTSLDLNSIYSHSLLRLCAISVFSTLPAWVLSWSILGLTDAQRALSYQIGFDVFGTSAVSSQFFPGD